ncbi:hypothetical protein EG328_004434 [Venturia inaequalis]|uniref:Fungal lipase-type domain-containing protein n=1 Tax=Venturia inaequalis TaxID=5025 RepID=A0A8H3UPX6_VENIN|nr:hypothetical protein EG328_004434 [Venturia inaequalis]
MARWLVFLYCLASIPLGLGEKIGSLAAKAISDLEFFEQVSAASYCSENTIGPNIRLRCRSGNCPYVDNAEIRTVIGLSNAPNTDVTGFVALDYTHNTTIVAFRGSESRLNWKMNFEISLVNVDFCQNCRAASGFWKSWTESRDPIIAALNAAQKSFPRNRVVVTGHSLGGAVATLAAGALRKNGFKVDLYTYGSPRVANEDLAVQLTLQAPSMGSNYRVTHLNDAVPQLPPQWFGYKHISPEYYISSNTGQNVSFSNITALPDFESHFGNYQWNRMSINAHGWYFNPVSACYTGPASDLGSGWLASNGTTAKTTWGKVSPGGKTSPDQAWLTAVFGQLGSFNPNPPKGVVPLSVPAGPNSHGNHPPDDGKPRTPAGAGAGGEGDDEPYYTGLEDGQIFNSEEVPTGKKGNSVMDTTFPDMDREVMEKFYGFDRKKFEEEKRVRRLRRLVPYGGLAKYFR